MEGVRNYFEIQAKNWVDESYDTSRGVVPIGTQRILLVKSILEQRFGDRKLRICDLGCGDGSLCRTLAGLGHDVTGVDQSSAMLELARDKTEQASLTVDYVQSSIEEAPQNIEIAEFDVVTSMGVMYYLDDENDFFASANSLLSNTGLLLITCRNRLFNIFNGSKKRKQAIDSGDAVFLLNEISDLDTSLAFEQVQLLQQSLRNTVSEEVTEQLKFDENVEKKTDELEKVIVEGKQHAPSEIKSIASGHGFSAEQVMGVQPHFLCAASTDKRADQHLKKMAEALIPLASLPISLTWSSHFLIELKLSK